MKMFTNHVSPLIMLILDNKDHVKSRQDGGHEVDVFLPLGVIPAAKHTVGSRQH